MHSITHPSGSISPISLAQVIDPQTGAVRRFVDFSGLFTAAERRAFRSTGEEVLNGLAYDEAENRLFVTGKCWPRIFEIAIDDVSGPV